MIFESNDRYHHVFFKRGGVSIKMPRRFKKNVVVFRLTGFIPCPKSGVYGFSVHPFPLFVNPYRLPVWSGRGVEEDVLVFFMFSEFDFG